MPWLHNDSEEVAALIEDLGGVDALILDSKKVIKGIFSEYEKDKTLSNGATVEFSFNTFLIPEDREKLVDLDNEIKIGKRVFRVFRKQKAMAGEVRLYLDEVNQGDDGDSRNGPKKGSFPISRK